ncbi:hypothetical protein CAPTEDRAFT_228273 [Capitella teleta]|uniref:UBX domain-containing protein n=1 Tax=Capitella teleta TaxID=283909 RepID=R7TKW1_CAPTE|nr:hypothetical protein CAPTEDRAFT_228273 [Capitella teleta]|eukprot:ELT92191.1 hypothetical protein CAPTEDRAFT_228273 [Capitella teleta]
MAEGVDLSAEQTEKLLQFQDLTGIDDIERCKQFLVTNNWDLEVAVQTRFGEQENRRNIYEDSDVDTERQPRIPVVNTNPSDQRVFTVMQHRPSGIFGWAFYLLSRFLDIFRFAFSLIRRDPRRYVTNPTQDVRDFISEFEDKYGPEHPPFHRGTYAEALNAAKRDLNFLMVYLHGDDHQDTPEFCRDTLTRADIKEFFSNQIVFWACSVNKPEGYRVSQALREVTYPFLALICLRQNRMTVIARFQGLMNPEELLEKVQRTIRDNESWLIAARADRDERNFNNQLRQEQDEAFLESLRADQEKERKKREEEELKEKEEEEERNKLLEEEREKEKLQRRKEQLRDELPAEPTSDDPNVIKILLKLPSGIRLERRFLKTHSLQHLHNYVLVHEAAPDDFQIVTNFPRRVLPTHPTDDVPIPPSFEDVGLGKSELLFVHDNTA